MKLMCKETATLHFYQKSSFDTKSGIEAHWDNKSNNKYISQKTVNITTIKKLLWKKILLSTQK